MAAATFAVEPSKQLFLVSAGFFDGDGVGETKAKDAGAKSSSSPEAAETRSVIKTERGKISLVLQLTSKAPVTTKFGQIFVVLKGDVKPLLIVPPKTNNETTPLGGQINPEFSMATVLVADTSFEPNTTKTFSASISPPPPNDVKTGNNQ
eukprot:CAMPEP_0197540566 /NCGR_PEP_ID=MMETSP1318-20131121/66369_1 /TAXON_ID=552666 /ORGANISM="Partenskyella glossopodia, Strain RCC365" /LENGTH=149 /DNA_ID=CAMNT_0043099613 /DNA_START=1 /DNA_END=447 /DNA_ORIENTATION=+